MCGCPGHDSDVGRRSRTVRKRTVAHRGRTPGNRSHTVAGSDWWHRSCSVEGREAFVFGDSQSSLAEEGGHSGLSQKVASRMDVERVGVAGRRRRRRWLLVASVLVLLAAAFVLVSRLEPAAPTVERDTVWVGTVERGPMLREVRGHGTLVPEVVRWVAASTAGTVERRLLEAGATVRPDDVIVELSNPELKREVRDAASALARASAELESLRRQLESERLSRRAVAARVQAELVEASLRAEADRELADKGLISSIELQISEAVAESAATCDEIERERIEVAAAADHARIEAMRAEVERRRALHQLRREQTAALRVTAGIAGVLQEIAVEEGEQVTPGESLALVANQEQLKARLRVPATRARDVRIGQAVRIDTRTGEVEGRVSRIDPAVREGTVLVDARLIGALPEGARPDLSVDGAIEIERLAEALYMGRPAFGDEHSTVGLFRIEPGGRHASRVRVELGRSSIHSIEVVNGLIEGDQVVLSDTSRWDEVDRIRLR